MQASSVDRYLPEYEELKAEYEMVLNRHDGLMSRSEYLSIVKALHADRRKAISDAELNTALDIFKKLEKVLLKRVDQSKPTPAFSFPRTYEEAMALKRKVAQQRKAKRRSKTAVQRA